MELSEAEILVLCKAIDDCNNYGVCWLAVIQDAIIINASHEKFINALNILADLVTAEKAALEKKKIKRRN